MATTRIPTDVQVVGELSCSTFAPPTSCIGDAAFKTSDPLTADKQQHRWIRQLTQVHGSAGVSERRVVHVAKGAGTIDLVRAGVVVACVGAATITVDVWKNGTTVLSAVISLGSADVAYAKKSGTVTVPAYAAGDVLEVVAVATAGGGTIGQGLFVDVICTEAPA